MEDDEQKASVIAINAATTVLALSVADAVLALLEDGTLDAGVRRHHAKQVRLNLGSLVSVLEAGAPEGRRLEIRGRLLHLEGDDETPSI